MKVMVACECSGVVRDAFIARGFDAVSCDTIDSDVPGPHIISDIRDVDLSDIDLLIAHPPCQYLAVSGARWWAGRESEQIDALEFVGWLKDAPVPYIAIENPVGAISTHWRPPDQYVQPWQFGDDASKKTGWWLKNLPKLVPTDIILKDQYANQTPSGQNKLGPSPTRAKERARTYEGMARAMAQQWGDYIKGEGGQAPLPF